MPVPASLYATVTCRLVLPVSVTTNARSAVPLSPSATLGELIESTGAVSSSLIVPVPSSVSAPPDSDALVAEDSCSTTVSFGSSTVSAVTVTVTVFALSPAANVSVPAVTAV